MLIYLFYLCIAIFVSFVYKIAISLILRLPKHLLLVILKTRGKDFITFFNEYPRWHILYGIINYSITGAIYSIIIFIITINFYLGYGGNIWFYIIASVLWSITIINGVMCFHWTILAPCTVGLILAWLGFSIFGPIIMWTLTIIVSAAYYFGRADAVKKQLSDQHMYF